MSPSDSLLDRLATVGLIDRDTVTGITGDGDGRSDDDTLRLLADRGVLTRWQARQFRAGRSRFTLDGGKYVLLDELGRGGMGAVYRARHTRMDREVAVKLIDSAKSAEPQMLGRFAREARIVSRLEHEHIVRALDVGEEEGIPYLVMEFVVGSDLSTIIAHDGPMAPGEAAAIILQTASGLAHAHEAGIVHRDVKPQNVLLSNDGVAKVLDLGLARFDSESDDHTALTREGTVMGTIDYMAPEQGVDTHAVDARADVYSLGATLYYLLAGRPPYAGGTAVEKIRRMATEDPPPLGQRRPDLPRELTDVVERMMARDPDDRFATMEDVVRALRPHAADRIAGRPVVTAAVQSAAETFRDGPTRADEPLFVPSDEPATSLIRRRPKSALPSMVMAGSVVTAALLGVVTWLATTPSTEGPKGPVRSLPEPKSPAGPPTAVRIELPFHVAGPTAMEWSPSGRWLATGARDGDVRVWDVEALETRWLYDGHDGDILDIAWSRDEERIASLDNLGRVDVWRVADGERLDRLDVGPTAGYFSDFLAFSPDGSELAIATGHAGAERLHRWRIGRPERFPPRDSGALCVCYTPDGTALITSGASCVVERWPLTDDGIGTATRVAEYESFPLVHAVDKTTFATTKPSSIELFDASSLERIRSIPIPDGGFRITAANRPAVTIRKSHAAGYTAGGGFVEVDLLSGTVVSGTGPPWVANAHLWQESPGREWHAVLTGSTVTLARETGMSRELQPRPVVTYAPTLEVLGDRMLRYRSGEQSKCWDLRTGERVHGLPETALVRDGVIRSIELDRVVEYPFPFDSSGGRTTFQLQGAESLQGADRGSLCGWMADGAGIWVRFGSGSLRVYDGENGAETGRIPNVEETAIGLVDPSARVVGIQQQRELVRLSVEGPLPASPELGKARTFLFGLSDDGLLAIGGNPTLYRGAEVWEVEKTRLRLNIDRGHTALHAHAEFNRDGSQVFVSDAIHSTADGRTIWQRSKGRIRNPFLLRGTFFEDGRHVAIANLNTVEVWDTEADTLRLTFFVLPDDGWAMFNHETGHWRGDGLAFVHLRLGYRTDEDGEPEWQSTGAFEKSTGWANDPVQAIPGSGPWSDDARRE